MKIPVTNVPAYGLGMENTFPLNFVSSKRDAFEPVGPVLSVLTGRASGDNAFEMRDDLGGGLLDSLAVRANHEAAQAPIERARGIELCVDVRGIGVCSGNGKSKLVVQPALTDIVDDACGGEQAVDARRVHREDASRWFHTERKRDVRHMVTMEGEIHR